ncbi:PREDICTED: insulin-like growth factor-binding protein 3 [Cyprinodon variegatus]|uniref:Insulin like growth factor binding protein 3 n=1 Tax=Cyprinodon variegatus TaxID=28743 RepID=A0A3Q2DIZ5_CYPVA|nr:PREDICTED: insulin-like growth factor-binding protein 3 [Cyprinodon variegatus]
MDSFFVALCMTFLVASLTRRSGAIGPVIRCEPCDIRARLLCKPLPKDCTERVREPGCGCCMTCALSIGQPCGVYTRRCSSGLTCQHQPGETKPLQALLEGRGVCVNSTNRQPSVRPTSTPPVNEMPDSKDKEGKPSSRHLETSCNPAPPRPSLYPYFDSAKSNAIRWEQQKATQNFKMEDLPGPTIKDQLNISLETKQESEYGPCRREIEHILSTLKIINILNPRGFRIPNCDKKGFYRKKQCRPSKGRKRGICWCVDKYGQPLPGFDGKDQGVQRYNSESQ